MKGEDNSQLNVEEKDAIGAEPQSCAIYVRFRHHPESRLQLLETCLRSKRLNL